MKKRKFMVVPRTGEAKENGVVTGKGHRKFNGKGAFFVSDAAEADEIDRVHGLKGKGDVWVHEDPVYEWSVHNDGSNGKNYDIHRNTFGPNKRFANAWEEFEKRRKDKQKRSKRRKSAEVTNGV